MKKDINTLELVLTHGCVIVNWYEYVIKSQLFNVNWFFNANRV